MKKEDWGLFLFNFLNGNNQTKTFYFFLHPRLVRVEVCAVVVNESVLTSDPIGTRQHAQKKQQGIKREGVRVILAGKYLNIL